MKTPTLTLGILLSVVISACAAPTYTTRHGLKVYDHTERGVSKGAVEALTEHALRRLGGAGLIDGVDVHIYSKLIAIKQTPTKVIIADGFTDPFARRILTSSFSDCLAASSLMHEIGHILHDVTAGDADGGHKDVQFWNTITDLENELKEAECTSEQLEAEMLARRSPDQTNQLSDAPPSSKPDEGETQATRSLGSKKLVLPPPATPADEGGASVPQDPRESSVQAEGHGDNDP